MLKVKMKGNTIMKALRYLLMAAILSLASVLSAANTATQTLAQQPEIIQMQSTSVMPASGSTLPQAAVNGVTTTEDNENGPKGHIRKWGSEGGSGEPGDWQEPYADPIGDAAIPLALLACAYLIIRVRRAKGDRTA